MLDSGVEGGDSKIHTNETYDLIGEMESFRTNYIIPDKNY